MPRNVVLRLAVLFFSMGLVSALQAEDVSRIAVTDLAYTRAVSEYFEAGTFRGSSQLYSDRHSAAVTSQSSGTYVAGKYSYLEQRELGSFTNDIKGALLRGTSFKLIQSRGFDSGTPQPTKAEQVLKQLKTGNVAAPVRQPEVKDIIARIKKGEFKGADYVLFGTLSRIEFSDQYSPLQGTTSATRQFGLDLLADFSLIDTKTYEIKASFSAQGAGNDTMLLSNRGDIVPPNRVKVMRETSQSLAANVFDQMMSQLGYVSGPQPGVTRAPLSPQPDRVIILK